jgi:PAS domain-containing protein
MKPIMNSDRKQKESHLEAALNALKKIESPYRALMDISPDATILSDQNGIIIMMNERLARLHGYENKQELIGENAFRERKASARRTGRGSSSPGDGHFGDLDGRAAN